MSEFRGAFSPFQFPNGGGYPLMMVTPGNLQMLLGASLQYSQNFNNTAAIEGGPYPTGYLMRVGKIRVAVPNSIQQRDTWQFYYNSQQAV